jgi:hypothetical protein
MMKRYVAPGEILFWMLSQNGELLSNFKSWKIVSLCFNLCNHFVIDQKGRSATLSLVVPTVRETLDAHRDLYSARILQPSSYEILEHLLSKFIARMAMNVEDICVTGYVLSFEGRNELRAREMGFAVAEVQSNGLLFVSFSRYSARSERHVACLRIGFIFLASLRISLKLRGYTIIES